MADNERTFLEAFTGLVEMTPDEAVRAFKNASLIGFRIADMTPYEQQVAAGYTHALLLRVQRENHELRLEDIPRKVEAMRPKRRRFYRAIDCLLEKK